MSKRGDAYLKFYQRMFVPGSMRVGATGIEQLSGTLMPKSGTAGTGVDTAPKGSIYTDTTRGTTWVNEGTKAAPYWSPTNADQPGLYSIHAPNFVASDISAEADSNTSVVLAPHGWTLLGDGLHENDSGALLAAASVQGVPGPLRLSSSAAAQGDLCALSTPIVSSEGIYQLDDNDMAVIDVVLSNFSAITARVIYVGFSGLAIAGQTDVVTGATTITTLVEDDLIGLYMASTASDPNRIIAAHNTSNGAVNQDYSAITALNTGVDMAAAGTAQRLRVEVDADGAFRMFIDKALVFTQVAATMLVTQELNALVYVSPTTTTQAELDIFSASFHMGVS